MTHILVVGGGFAGVWSALSAARMRRDMASDEITIQLVTPGNDLVIRPRLYERNPGKMRVPLARILAPVGVVHIAATVTSIETSSRQVSTVTTLGRAQVLDYDKLVVAAGSQLVLPDFPGAEHLHNVDTIECALALETHLTTLAVEDSDGRFTAVVVGAGFTGLEVATELVDRLRELARPLGMQDLVRVVLVEQANTVGPELGEKPRPLIERSLTQLGIRLRLGATVMELTALGARLSTGEWIPSRTLVWTAGMQANPLTADISRHRDPLGRLAVDTYLRVEGVPDVFAAGDTAAARADSDHTVTQSCQHAIPQGKTAGRNAAAELLSAPLAHFKPSSYVTCLDLGSSGAVYTSGWERAVQKSGAEAKRQKQLINREWIYPPVDNPRVILREADPDITTRSSKLPF